MQTVLAVVRPFHSALTANALHQNGIPISIYSSAPRKCFRGLSEDIPVSIVIEPAAVIQKLVPIKIPPHIEMRSIEFWDRLVGLRIQKAGLVIGYATQSLRTGCAAKKMGARFFLDRACPHVDFQQRLVREEADLVGGKFVPQPSWFRDRQLAEYDLADRILVPSSYSSASFPAYLQPKLGLAPLLGRFSQPREVNYERHSTFTVGVVGGDPLRKGYIYLLEAWRRLALPDAKLLLRSSGNFSAFPRLAELLRSTKNVEIVGYVADICEFYKRCDLFVLPSIDDGFGMALFEAMNSGVASIATSHCGASELLQNGIEGLIVQPRSVEELMAAILQLYENEELRRTLALAGSKRVKQIAGSSLYADALMSQVNAS